MVGGRCLVVENFFTREVAHARLVNACWRYKGFTRLSTCWGILERLYRLSKNILYYYNTVVVCTVSLRWWNERGVTREKARVITSWCTVLCCMDVLVCLQHTLSATQLHINARLTFWTHQHRHALVTPRQYRFERILYCIASYDIHSVTSFILRYYLFTSFPGIYRRRKTLQTYIKYLSSYLTLMILVVNRSRGVVKRSRYCCSKLPPIPLPKIHPFDLDITANLKSVGNTSTYLIYEACSRTVRLIRWWTGDHLRCRTPPCETHVGYAAKDWATMNRHYAAYLAIVITTVCLILCGWVVNGCMFSLSVIS